MTYTATNMQAGSSMLLGCCLQIPATSPWLLFRNAFPYDFIFTASMPHGKKWYFQAHCLWLWISPSHEGLQSKTWTSSILHLAQTGTRWYYASGFRMLFDLDKNKINNNIVSNVATFSDYQTYHSSFKITIWRMMPVAWILNVLLHFK